MDCHTLTENHHLHYTVCYYGLLWVGSLYTPDTLPLSRTPCLTLSTLGGQSHIAGLEEEEFAAHRKALEVRRLEKPKTMAEECQKLWSEISADTYYFNRGL